MSTNIDDMDDVEEEVIIDEENDYENIFNFELDNDTRLGIFNDYHNDNQDDILEIVNKLNAMYLVSGTNLLHDFIELICKESYIDDNLKVECAKCLCLVEETKENYGILEYILKNITKISVPCHVDAIIYLMKSDDYKDTCNDEFCKIIDNHKLDCDYRYKIILSLNLKLEDKEKIEYYTVNSTVKFVQNPINYTMYRILGCQLLLQCYDIDDEQRIMCEENLCTFMNDTELHYNVRADAADVLLKLGNERNKEKAKDVIMELAQREGPIDTIYKNAENVHHHEIEESCIEILEFLHNKFMKMNVSIDDIESGIVKHWELCNTSLFMKDINDLDTVRFEDIDSLKQKYYDKFIETYNFIQISLNRIKMDRALYGKFNCNLQTILMQVWMFIRDNEHSDEMKSRLVEELVDMAGKCSTGFAFRIINVLSGFGDFTIRISWEEQLCGNLVGRMNKYIREIEDPDYKGDILNEIILNKHENLHERPNFFKFLREILPELRHELWEEYKEYITDADFDLYFRKAMSKYEGF